MWTYLLAIKKKNPGTWNEECQEAFNKIKQYIQNPPLLVHPISRTPLILYLTVTEVTMRYVLCQHDETRKKERVIYYLSKKFTKYESRYMTIEKLCCALVWVEKNYKIICCIILRGWFQWWIPWGIYVRSPIYQIELQDGKFC